MFQNVAYRPTVYKTGYQCEKSMLCKIQYENLKTWSNENRKANSEISSSHFVLDQS